MKSNRCSLIVSSLLSLQALVGFSALANESVEGQIQTFQLTCASRSEVAGTSITEYSPVDATVSIRACNHDFCIAMAVGSVSETFYSNCRAMTSTGENLQVHCSDQEAGLAEQRTGSYYQYYTVKSENFDQLLLQPINTLRSNYPQCEQLRVVAAAPKAAIVNKPPRRSNDDDCVKQWPER